MDSHTRSNQNEHKNQPKQAELQSHDEEYTPALDSDELQLRPDQKQFTPKQVIQLQRTIGNQATLQLMRKRDAKPRDYSRLKMLQRDEKSGGLPPPPDYDDEPSDEKTDVAPPFMSEVSGQNFNYGTGLPAPESTIKQFNDISNPVRYADKVFGAYMQHLQHDPDDKTFTDFWQDNEIERLAEGWVKMDSKDQKTNQYALSELVKEDERVEHAVSAKQFEQSDETVGKISETLETGVNVSSITGAGFSTAEGVKLASQLKDGIGAVNTASGVFEATFGSILSIAWLPLLIGYEAVRAVKYHKRRRDGYKTRMDALKDTKQSKDDIKLFDIAKYAYKKTRRAFIYSMTKIALKIVRMIALIITLLTGGTSAVVTASIAAIAAAVETSTLLFRKIKGLGKLMMGTRGKNREKNAEQLVKLAKGGRDDAAQTIIDVDPFDEATMKAFRVIGNKVAPLLIDTSLNPVTNSRQVMQGLEKPANAKDLIFMLQKRPEEGGWTAEHETMLARSLANTMLSQ